MSSTKCGPAGVQGTPALAFFLVVTCSQCFMSLFLENDVNPMQCYATQPEVERSMFLKMLPVDADLPNGLARKYQSLRNI